MVLSLLFFLLSVGFSNATDFCPASIDLKSLESTDFTGTVTSNKRLYSTQWFTPKAKPRGVILVVHGLNNNPNSLNVISNHFRDQGLLVLRLALLGHRGDKAEAETVTTEAVRKQVFKSYCLVFNRATRENVPYYLLGYSLGGSIVIDLVESQRINTDNLKHIYLMAPSLKLQGKSSLTWLATALPDAWSLPSQMMPEYRANDYTPFALYKLVWDFYSRNEESQYKVSKRMPVSIYMDYKDQLVDSEQLTQLASQFNSWKMNFVSTESGELHKNTHHQLMDQKGLGVKEFTRMMRLFFKNL